jgi:CDP-2,3-bis-(O-geranylgeranyl)-sn-glycerol synthase
MIHHILFALWFFTPAGLANAAPVFANRVPLLSRLGMPIDAGKKFRGKRIFGDHKTVRGIVVGTLVGSLTGYLQYLAYANIPWIRSFSIITYTGWQGLALGTLLGFGALAGDAIKSFFKRQFSVPSGKAWFPFDQTDYIIGGLALSTIVVTLPINRYPLIALVWFLIHPVATFIAWLLGLKDSPI